MKKLCVVLSAIFLSFQVLGHGKLVLLTSLDPDKNRPPLRSDSWNINEKVEERFKKSFKRIKTDITPVIKHFAGPQDLHDVLTDPEVLAVIWVGHAGFTKKPVGLVKNNVIVDYKGRDIKNLFQAAHKNLKFLGLVGCRGQYFIDDWNKEGWFKDHTSLETFGRKIRTSARIGLRKAMKALKKRIEDDSSFYDMPEVDTDESELSVLIERTNNTDKKMDSIQIRQKNTLIGFMPASTEDQFIVAKLKVGKSKFDYKIISDTGFASPAPVNPTLGRLSITLQTHNDSLNGNWELFKTREGKPIGIGKNIYQFKGEVK